VVATRSLDCGFNGAGLVVSATVVDGVIVVASVVVSSSVHPAAAKSMPTSKIPINKAHNAFLLFIHLKDIDSPHY